MISLFHQSNSLKLDLPEGCFQVSMGCFQKGLF